MKKTLARRLLFAVLLLAVPSCISPHAKESAGSPHVYKRASFRTWQLFDSIDSRYTPFRLSRVTDIEASGERGWASPPRRDGCGEDWVVAPPVPNESTRSKAFRPCDDRPDINPMLERVDLEALAELCCRGMKGRLFFLPGRRITPTYSIILAGLKRRFVPYLPASFLAEGEVRTARLLDNLWLLYQLEQQGWVEPVDARHGCRWRWSRKAAELTEPSPRVLTLARMTQQQRDYFAGLTLIAPGACVPGYLPPIPCCLIATKEEVSQRVDELRDSEGYPGNIGLFWIDASTGGLKAINPAHEQAWRSYLAALPQKQTVMAGEQGLKVILAPDGKKSLAPHQKALFRGNAAAYQFDVFVCNRELPDYYRPHRYHCPERSPHVYYPDEKRKPSLIYEKL